MEFGILGYWSHDVGLLKMGYWDNSPMNLGYWPSDIGIFGIPGSPLTPPEHCSVIFHGQPF